ncbi:MAG TPA: hypothetical protein VH352_09150, partial [Pseudonocardiaceae bacterium]|nr:hypothetical protein [Pseudonocardiaceae bacterium]
MESLSSTAMHRIGRIALPVVAALAAVLVSTQGASAATATPTHPLPPLPCVQPGPGTQVPTVSQAGGSGGVIVTRPVPGRPGQPGKCVGCGMRIKVGSGHVMPMRTIDKCFICIVKIGTGK